MNVLVIDEDELDCISICRQIASEFQCDFANNEKEALLKLKQKHFDCILLDYVLKDSTGLELIPKIKEITLAPIIFVTGKGSEDIAVKALKAGASDYVVKTLKNYNKLLLAIKNCIEDNKRAKKQLDVLKRIQQDIAFRLETTI